MSSKISPVDAQLRDEFRFKDGVGYVAIRALARMLDVPESSLRDAARRETSKLARSLAASGFDGARISDWGETGVPDAACAVIAHYYAFDAQKTSKQARAFLKLTSAMGVRGWVRDKCQGLDERWAKARIDGKRVRHPFTQALQDHGCEGPDIANITDNNNLLATGKRAKQLKAERAPDSKGKVSGRQLMTTAELSMTAVLEATQTAQIGLLAPSGPNECLAVCSAAGMKVLQLLSEPMQGVLKPSPAVTVSPSELFRAV